LYDFARAQEELGRNERLHVHLLLIGAGGNATNCPADNES
jgi:hypothetical protein